MDFRKSPPNPPFQPITAVLAGMGTRLNLTDYQLDTAMNELERVFSKRMVELWDRVPNAYVSAQSVWDAQIGFDVGQCLECAEAGLVGQRCDDDVAYMLYTHPRTKERVSLELPQTHHADD